MSILSDFTQDELNEVIEENSSLRGYLQGYLAEVALKKQLLLLDDVSSVTKIPDQSLERGDLKVVYRGMSLTIEVKSIKTDSVRQDIMHDTWQGTVAVKSSDKREIEVEGLGIVRTSNLVRGGFDILAISCYAVSGNWDFVYMDNEYLPSKNSSNPDLIKTSFVINPETTPCLDMGIESILNYVYEKKRSIC